MLPTEMEQSGFFCLRVEGYVFRAYAFYGGANVKGRLKDMPLSQFLSVTFYTLSPLTMADMMAMPSVKSIASSLTLVGVRAWLARGYFIPGGASQRGGGQAPMFQCRMLSDLDYPGLRSVTYDVPARRILATVK